MTVELSFARTVDRALVHRSSVAEVFVTDEVSTGESEIMVAAQLPLSHGYYSDHVQDPPLFDPLLLLECCRQAAICGSHVLGIPLGTAMLVTTFEIRLTDPGALRVGARPGELRILGSYTPAKVRAGRVRHGYVDQELFLGDRPVGIHHMEVLFMTSAEHETFRQLQRSSAPVSTLGMADPEPLRQLAPHRVGRRHPLNVVLSDAVADGARLTAGVTPRFGNRALFDHDYDHLPAMVLSEAARQLALLAHGGAGGLRVVGVGADFHRYAELDQPLLATAETAPGDGETRVVRVEFTQRHDAVAAATVSLAPLNEDRSSA